jgi:TonB dependent receptor
MEERMTGRFGLRHSFSPNSIFLGSFMYQDVVFRTDVSQLPLPFLATRNKRPESANIVEFQHLFRSARINVTSGVGYAKIDGHTDNSIATFLPPPLDFATGRFGTDLKHINTYFYSYINVLKGVTLTLGASGDFTNGESPDVGRRQQFNPKFGVTWNPLPGTTIRTAAFRVLKRTLITDQTVEPTQIAGFNQFYDDNNGTGAWRYGGAIDQKFTRELFGGVEASRRDLKSRFVQRDVFSSAVTLGKEDVVEDTSRVYLFWTPHPWLALRWEYAFEHLESEGLLDQPKRLQTHRVPLGFNLFHPSGLSASLRSTYVSQNGRFVLTDGSSQTGSEDFWTIDSAINYRLPKRYGFLTIGATNIADRKFKFFERDTKNPTIQPARMIFGRLTLALP